MMHLCENTIAKKRLRFKTGVKQSKLCLAGLAPLPFCTFAHIYGVCPGTVIQPAS
jgi:hypothetical protein